MPDMGTMQDHIEDLMLANKQLREQRDHYRRALDYLAAHVLRIENQTGTPAIVDVSYVVSVALERTTYA